ncbi:hypothetical protein QAD02_020004 [Eretmocerus hayati]|uniref:Uncharacterized protein n=1 Tax=Eretmocerus hayati TaxID=131215 RepID=A0ACC2PL77_9HYME|nr:hypothetical protein QAD02_020004 [Eretmocerus hayati]
MAARKSVTVLTPNGRRATVKVDLNTTILQVLEEVCLKHNFPPEEYDLKHYQKILDVNSTFRYANISNNACLEMVKCKVPRKVANVTICVQTEEGNRLTGEFSPQTNIKSVLLKLGVESGQEDAVIVYMQREIYSKEFEELTLKSLGLGSGTALFRLLKRDPGKSKEQAHVYVPPKPKVSKVEESVKDERVASPNANQLKKDVINPLSIIRDLKTSDGVDDKTKDNEKNFEKKSEAKNEQYETEIQPHSQNQEEIPMDIDTEVKPQNHTSLAEEAEEEPQVEFLGERNALLFNQAGARAMHHNEIPDDFFDLTISDAKALLRDARRTQSQLQDAPLLTAALRELEKDKAKLNYLHKYQQSIIRIQFPSQMVLQGLFKPLETVQTIKDFVRTYLEHPESDFTLYTSPPRCDLGPNERLLDVNLVPSAIVHYSGKSDIKSKLKSKVTDPSIASRQAEKTRSLTMRDNASMVDDDLDDLVIPSTSKLTEKPGTSYENDAAGCSAKETQVDSSKQKQPSTTTKAPKWFKLSSK